MTMLLREWFGDSKKQEAKKKTNALVVLVPQHQQELYPCRESYLHAAHRHPGQPHSDTQTLTEVPSEFICQGGTASSNAARFASDC